MENPVENFNVVIFKSLYYNRLMEVNNHKIAAQKLKEKFGSDWYAKIGRVGGKKSRGGGFASKPYEFCAACGRKGGKISRRGKCKTQV